MPFRVVPTGDMFQRKIGELFQGIPNLFDITDDILIAGLNELGRDHDETVVKTLKGQPKTQQRQVQFQIHQHSLLRGK